MLRLCEIDPIPSEISWSIDAPTPGVVIVDVAIGPGRVPVPLHWRAGSWTKPPLDVTLDNEGRLTAIQFVLQDEQVEFGGVLHNQCGAPKIGIPRFEVSSWPEDRYWDERLPVVAHRTGVGELLLHIGERRQLCQQCAPGPGLLLGFDQDVSLATVKIGPMAIDDWASIDAFSIGT